MLDVVVENEDVAGLGFEGDAWDVGAVDAPVVLGLPDFFLDLVAIRIADTMAAGDDAETAGVFADRVAILMWSGRLTNALSECQPVLPT